MSLNFSAKRKQQRGFKRQKVCKREGLKSKR